MATATQAIFLALMNLLLNIPGIKDWVIDYIALPLLDGLFKDGTIYTYIQPTIDAVMSFDWHSISSDAGAAMDFVKDPHIKVNDHYKGVQDAIWWAMIGCCMPPLALRGFQMAPDLVHYTNAPFH